MMTAPKGHNETSDATCGTDPEEGAMGMAIDMDNIRQRANDLADQASDVAEDLGVKAKPYVDQAREAVTPLAEKARPYVSQAREAVSPLAEKARDKADEFAQQAQPYVEQARDRASDFAEQAQPYVEQAREAAGDLAGKAKPHAERARDWATGMLEAAFDFLEETTKTDLDGDGVIGAAVKEALEIEVVPSDAAELSPAEEETEEAEEPEVE